MGATAIWINPVQLQIPEPLFASGPPETGTQNGFEHWGFHGYWMEDFGRIDPQFGTEAELKALVAKQKTLNEQLAPYQDQLDKINRIEMDLSQLEQEVEVDRQNYRLHLTGFDESRSSNAMSTETIATATLLESAHAPLKPVSPKKLRNLMLGFLLGAFGGLGLAFFMECLDNRLERPEQVVNALKLPVLASIPESKS